MIPRKEHHGAARVGRKIGSVIGTAIDAAFGTAEHLGKSMLAPLLLPGSNPQQHAPPGAPPGIESVPDVHTPPPPGTIAIQCIDYGRERIERTDVTDLDAFLAAPRPAWAAVRWINIDALHPYTVHRVMTAFGFHTLAAEDVLHVPQRPKLDPFDSELFIVTRMLTVLDERLTAEQISLFYRPDLLVSFQEAPGDVWQPTRDRLGRPESRLRQSNAGLLLHALLDAIVDQCFPILEHFGDILEDMETTVVQRPDPASLRHLHAVKHQLVLLRRVMWPMREMLSALQDEQHKSVPKAARAYIRDVGDHAVQVIDIIESYREVASGMTDLYMSAVSNRMNEAMKVLTMISTIFIPITFLAGVYGMNFEYIPEMDERWAYPTFWAICTVTTVSLLVFFKRKGWF